MLPVCYINRQVCQQAGLLHAPLLTVGLLKVPGLTMNMQSVTATRRHFLQVFGGTNTISNLVNKYDKLQPGIPRRWRDVTSK